MNQNWQMTIPERRAQTLYAQKPLAKKAHLKTYIHENNDNLFYLIVKGALKQR